MFLDLFAKRFGYFFLQIEVLSNYWDMKVEYIVGNIGYNLWKWKELPKIYWKLTKRTHEGRLYILLVHCVKSVQIRSFFWSVFSRIRTENGEIRSISPYSVRIWENTAWKNSVFRHFSLSGTLIKKILLLHYHFKLWTGFLLLFKSGNFRFKFCLRHLSAENFGQNFLC